MEDTFQPQQNPTFPPLSTSSSPKRSPFVPIAIILIIIAVSVFAATKLLGSRSSKQLDKGVVATPTPTAYQFPTDTPTPTPTEVAPTTTAKPTINPVDTTTGLDRSTLTVTVQNGSGETGAGSKAAEVIKGLGYHVTSIGNASNFNFIDVTIQVKSAESKFLPLLKKDLGFNYTVGSTSADLTSDFSSDALVIIGK